MLTHYNGACDKFGGAVEFKSKPPQENLFQKPDPRGKENSGGVSIVKKIIAAVLLLGIVGSVVVGCAPKAEEPAATPPAAPAEGATTG